MISESEVVSVFCLPMLGNADTSPGTTKAQVPNLLTAVFLPNVNLNVHQDGR